MVSQNQLRAFPPDSMQTIESTIKEKLNTAFSPSVLQVENESHKHNVPAGSESHFKVTVVSSEFEGKRLLQRHRTINTALKAELEQIHALSIHTFTESEWSARSATSNETPPCLGGDRS